MNEFDVIAEYFAPLTMGHDALKDDGAVIAVPDGHELVISSDTLNAGTHFLEAERAENIAHKALRVNISDIISMGADPLCYQLNIAYPQKPDEKWLKAFCDALMADNQAYNVYCSGGDTTSIKGGVLSISITILGTVPRGQAVRRMHAKDGDNIVITGGVGDAVTGLSVLTAGHEEPLYKMAVDRYRRPRPRHVLASAIRRYANACADISDGLIADARNIAAASGLGMEIDISKLSFSDDVERAISEGIITQEEVICSGDDYELILAVSDANLPLFLAECDSCELNPQVIGKFSENGLKTTFLNTGSLRINALNKGWTHF